MTIETHNQLKALSDPLRADIMMYVVERPYTGQQLSEVLDIPRGKIHYHLKDLEKNGLIEIVKTEEKNGIMQKFYQSVAAGFTMAEHLLPYQKEVDATTRQIFYGMIDRLRKRVQTAPSKAFDKKNVSQTPEEWGYMATSTEIEATEEQFKAWIKSYHALLKELEAMGKEPTTDEKHTYSMFTMSFQVDESEFGKRMK